MGQLWDQIGQLRAHMGPLSVQTGQLGAQMCQLWAEMGQLWDQIGQLRALGVQMSQLKPIWALIWPNWAPCWPILVGVCHMRKWTLPCWIPCQRSIKSILEWPNIAILSKSIALEKNVLRPKLSGKRAKIGDFKIFSNSEKNSFFHLWLVFSLH